MHGSPSYKIIHTGQHCDQEMNDMLLDELGVPEPDVFIAAGGGSDAQWMGKITVAFEEHCQAHRPHAVPLVGDVNSTLACSIVAKMLCILVARAGAGLRGGDIAMPEMINRLVADRMSDCFFVAEVSGVVHLKHEGRPNSAIDYVGHVMVDSVLCQADQMSCTGTHGLQTEAFKKAALAKCGCYGVITHRPSNVEDCRCIEGDGRQVAVQVPGACTYAQQRGEVGDRSRAKLTLLGPQARCPSSTRGTARQWCSPTAAAGRRKPRHWAYRASPFARARSEQWWWTRAFGCSLVANRRVSLPRRRRGCEARASSGGGRIFGMARRQCRSWTLWQRNWHEQSH